MNEIVPTGQAAIDARAEAAKARAETAAAHLELQRQADAAKAELAAQRAAMEAEFRAKMAEIEAAAAPMKAELDRLAEVGKTIDLYLGRDEDVVLLRDGAPAPAQTPLVIRSTVLYADEESLALLDRGGVDFRSMGDFLDWLVAAPENLDRVAPDQRCIVVVKPSRQGRDYGDAWMNATAMTENERPHWIIRNGERVYLLVTGGRVEHRGADRPSRGRVHGHVHRPRRASRTWVGGLGSEPKVSRTPSVDTSCG
jgi:hypothetical protein